MAVAAAACAVILAWPTPAAATDTLSPLATTAVVSSVSAWRGTSPTVPPASGDAPASDGQGLPLPEPSPADVRSTADDVLADPKYEEPPKSIWERVGEWISERLADLFGTMSGGSGGGFAWIAVAFLVGALVYLATRMRGSFHRRRREREDPLFVTELEARRTADDWIAEAQRLEAAADWKPALRCRYRALLGRLIDLGVVRDIPGRTSGEFRYEVRRSHADLAPAFATASELFDAAWYGDEPTGPDENARFRALAEKIVAGAEAGPSGPATDVLIETIP